MIRFIDLFAGIGGFRYGLEQVRYSKQEDTFVKSVSNPCGKGIKEQFKDRSLQRSQFDCVWSNEYDKYAAQIYRKHWGECDTRDIRTVEASQIPDHDLLCGGFPCQAFSIAGKRLGFNDTRGTLFYEIARIAKNKRPRHLLLENVKGLLSHQEGKTFQTMLGVLADIGYRVEWVVLNSKDFGVPQNRERVFIVGHSGRCRGGQVFPIGRSSQTADEVRNENDRHRRNIWNSQSQDRGTAERRAVSKLMRQPLRYLNRNQKNIDGDYAFTVEGTNTGGIKEGMRIRRLTPTECERLQGFPDGFTAGLSDTQRYKCLGNAVTTTVITEIGKKLLKHEFERGRDQP